MFTIQARSFCELWSLSRNAFNFVMPDFPIIHKRVIADALMASNPPPSPLVFCFGEVFVSGVDGGGAYKYISLDLLFVSHGTGSTNSQSLERDLSMSGHSKINLSRLKKDMSDIVKMMKEVTSRAQQQRFAALGQAKRRPGTRSNK